MCDPADLALVRARVDLGPEVELVEQAANGEHRQGSRLLVPAAAGLSPSP